MLLKQKTVYAVEFESACGEHEMAGLANVSVDWSDVNSDGP